MNKDALIAALMVGGGSGGGTEVIANPTLVGTESDLTGIQVGDTKYKVPEELPDTTGASVGDVLTIGNDGAEWATPSGGTKYQHNIVLTPGIDGSGYYTTVIINDISTPMTKSDIQEYVSSGKVSASGIVVYSGLPDKAYMGQYFFVENNSLFIQCAVLTIDSDNRPVIGTGKRGFSSNITFTDSVYPI